MKPLRALGLLLVVAWAVQGGRAAAGAGDDGGGPGVVEEAKVFVNYSSGPVVRLAPFLMFWVKGLRLYGRMRA